MGGLRSVHPKTEGRTTDELIQWSEKVVHAGYPEEGKEESGARTEEETESGEDREGIRRTQRNDWSSPVKRSRLGSWLTGDLPLGSMS